MDSCAYQITSQTIQQVEGMPHIATFNSLESVGTKAQKNEEGNQKY